MSTGAKQPKDPISGQKVTQYIGVMQAPGAGTAWALNTDSVRNGLPGGPNSFGGFEGSGYPGKPGAIGSENGTIGYELDFTNWDAHSAPGSGPFTVGQYVHAQGSFTSLSAVYFDAHMGNGAKAWHSAIFFNGEDVVDENTIVDATHSKVSYNVMGVHQIGINMSQSNADLKAIVMKEGQSVCFSGLSNCVSMVNNKLSYRNKAGSVIFSIDEDGNAFFAGRVNQGALR
ncbi:hypothetical protein [Methylorubrum sp. POS3]|uniref:hypothetical protein n=1 Tax=Methylorubrum sp. POS3 TaxID=2998492 RepID=UPI00372BBA42